MRRYVAGLYWDDRVGWGMSHRNYNMVRLLHQTLSNRRPCPAARWIGRYTPLPSLPDYLVVDLAIELEMDPQVALYAVGLGVEE